MTDTNSQNKHDQLTELMIKVLYKILDIIFIIISHWFKNI